MILWGKVTMTTAIAVCLEGGDGGGGVCVCMYVHVFVCHEDSNKVLN